jgi:glycosyltransferase involved in cell wall biosynthesis
VVTTDAGGIPYVVTHEETGLMVRMNDHEALAAAAMRLLEDDELAQKLARQARGECAKYNWRAVRGEWLKLYNEVAGRASAVELEA